MRKVTGTELLTVKKIVQALNEAYPVNLPGIPVKKWVGNNLVSTFSKPDPHFLAYFHYGTGVWWLVCRQYDAWIETYDFMKQFCELLLQDHGVIAHPCHMHPISMGYYKELHLKKQVLMLGDVSWYTPAKKSVHG